MIWALFEVMMRQNSGGANLARCSAVLEQELAKADQELQRSFDLMEAMDPMYLPSYLVRERKKWKEEGNSVYVFSEDSLILWTDNSIPEISSLRDWKNSGPCLLLENGWYILRSQMKGNKEFFGLILLKHEYKYENRYLKNNFNPRFSLDEGLQISFTPDGSKRPVTDIFGEELFYLVGDSSHIPSTAQVILYFISLAGAVFLGLFLFMRLFFSEIENKKRWAIVSLVLGMFPLLCVYLWGIAGLDGFKVFDPAVFASSRFFPSLAHVFYCSLLIFSVPYGLWAVFRNQSKSVSWFTIIGLFSLYILICRAIDILIRILVKDSNVVLDVTDLFHWDISSLVALMSISLLLFGTWYLARMLSSFLRSSEQFKPFAFFSLAIFFLILLGHGLGIVDMVKVLWSTVLLIVVYLSDGMRWKSSTSLMTLLGLSVLALYASLALEKELERKENRFLGLVADRLMETKDDMAENLFIQAEEEMRSDSILWDLLDEGPQNQERILDLLRTEHLGDYWSKYELEIKEPMKEELLELGVDSTEQVALYHTAGMEPGLNYLLRLSADSSTNAVLFIGFKLNVFPEELGFPELLQEGNSVIGQALNRYSMAYYIDSRLIDQFGEHRFPIYLESSFLEAEQPQGRLFLEDGYRYVEFNKDAYTYLISRPDDSWMDVLTTFTYFLSFLGLMLGIGLLFAFLLWNERIGARGLQSKVQVLVIAMVLGSLSIFGLGAYSYIISQNVSKNQRILGEKVDSVLIELSQKIQREQSLSDPVKLQSYLIKFSKVFFSDINLYDLRGALMATSREQLFNKGISSELIDPEALDMMKKGETLFVHEETIGSLTYLSAYVPFMDTDNHIVAYLNLPYFAKQGELENELSQFLVAVVNVLILLFIISIIMGVMVSSWLTHPLQLLKDNLAQVRLGSTNRPLEYEGSDEISSLVQAYNAKVQELQENAELLAKGERESAWREMAKQVAHEIKNPLTPMKLSIQYLQRSAQDKSPDWEDRFKRSTDMLIEQIDTLSGIATAFSDFAKMPSLRKELFDLRLLLDQVVGLFENDPTAKVTFNTELGPDQEVWADKDQMTRLFTNLIKNAVQSIPEEEEGRIQVSLLFKGYQYIIEVKDNGTGIDPEMREKIFEPNFTTKTTGTGLGLAMCKNIIELSGGDIWFKTEIGKGSSFFVSLPAGKTEEAHSQE